MPFNGVLELGSVEVLEFQAIADIMTPASPIYRETTALQHPKRLREVPDRGSDTYDPASCEATAANEGKSDKLRKSVLLVCKDQQSHAFELLLLNNHARRTLSTSGLKSTTSSARGILRDLLGSLAVKASKTVGS